jgi:hypothetical protein
MRGRKGRSSRWRGSGERISRNRVIDAEMQGGVGRNNGGRSIRKGI